MGYEIRRASDHDADDISRVILDALRQTNAKDYTLDIIARVELSFSPAAVKDLIDRRDVFVALLDNRLVGTASLDGQAVRSMFVAPDLQGQGVGRMLIKTVERHAIERGIAVLQVPATVTAEAFYAKLGFRSVREAFYGEERTIIMEKVLPPPADR